MSIIATQRLRNARNILSCPIFLTSHTVHGTTLIQEAVSVFPHISWHIAKEI
jgi:hypothetical protein